ncbi:MAG: substrate-binding domain-containing protein [Firmicutes bacterium]|nr:substrate-binding domain-containing protein [Bacillota bacterium]
MKKILALTLCVVMAAAVFTGCGSKSSNGEADGAPITVISREDGSGTRGAFTELMGIMVDDVDNTTTSAEISQSTSVVLTTVAGNKNSIGYLSLGSLNDTVKAVKVDGVDATVENIKGGSYAVSRPFLVVTNDKLTDVSKDFIKFILSKQGQDIIAEEGYITIDDNAADYETQKGISGKIVLAGSTSVSPVMQKLADAYKAIYSDVTLEIQQTGSGAGITSTIEGACDIGMSSRDLKPEETAEGIEGTTIAMDGIAVVVNNENSVEDLTSEQIRQIFTGEVTDWSQVK